MASFLYCSRSSGLRNMSTMKHKVTSRGFLHMSDMKTRLVTRSLASLVTASSVMRRLASGAFAV
jgi:hypothetical protein